MVTSKLDVSKERLKEAVDTADGRPRAIVFTADVKALLEHIAKLEAENARLQDQIAAHMKMRNADG